MQPRERRMLLAAVALASGATLSCSSLPPIGVYDPGLDAGYFPNEAGNAPGFVDGAPDAAKPADATGE